MRFGDALNALQLGFSVRNKEWSKDIFYEQHNDQIYLRHPNKLTKKTSNNLESSKINTFSNKELFCSDWEIYDKY